MTSWRHIDEALGLAGPDAALLEAFAAAGFDQRDARRGVSMMTSGRYLGFADVAMSLAQAGGHAVTPVQTAQIAEAARVWDARGGDQISAGRTAWGRQRFQESPGRDAAKTAPAEADFCDVGLNETDAKSAAEGLTAGRFVSFEDACLATALFGETKNVSLNESLMRAKAKEFARAEGR